MHITVTKGFGVSIFASDLGDAKQIAVGDQGTIFVGSGKSGKVTALVNSNQEGRVERRYTIAKNLKYPEAIAYHNGDLYVISDSRILRYRDVEKRLRRLQRPKVVYDKLPDFDKRYSRVMHFGPDGRLYVALGAPCNVCEVDAPYSSIIAIDINTGNTEQIASGIRSARGFDWSPSTERIWFVDSGRDWMGDNLPADEINRIDHKGQHFGFPYIHGKDVKEPAYRQPANLAVKAPEYELPAHVEPVGMLFYQANQLPKKYHNQLFIAENGSRHRSSKVGYQVVWLKVENDKILSRQTLMSFLDGGFPVARPYSLATGKDGAMYISDDLKGNVYRLFYKDHKPEQQQEVNND
ncbi:PQQ-dependent sugar dehydrogenase [Parashewanella tropica]|uniref:PQQ-dependent sugar dehydrogenase n=1 Tax=Parashewanella tropica TaxID=2547970 RepID=UPI00105A4738|nr:PQQ-dependent sugar dehydrogenase [Parashewanella tropica]